MLPEDSHVEYTALAVQLGVLQEGQRNTLSGIDEIKEILTDHSGRLGGVETSVQVLTERVNGHDTILRDNREDAKEAKPEKGRWVQVGALCISAAVFIFFILDRFYLPAAH